MSEPAQCDSVRARAIAGRLARSRVYRNYERAFRDATGLPLALRIVGAPDLPPRDQEGEDPFCALMASRDGDCADCMLTRHGVGNPAAARGRVHPCFAGLHETAVPVRVGGHLIAVLQSGRMLVGKPSRTASHGIARRLAGRGTAAGPKCVVQAYLRTRMMTAQQHECVLRLLSAFSRHLSTLGDRTLAQEERPGSPQIARARAYIASHQDEDLSLNDVAKAVNMNAFYFCKTFRQTTGRTFTEYLARARVEAVKAMLRDPERRVSEAAFAAGFQSLSQFNRVFRKVAGEAPSAFRERNRRDAEAWQAIRKPRSGTRSQ